MDPAGNVVATRRPPQPPKRRSRVAPRPVGQPPAEPARGPAAGAVADRARLARVQLARHPIDAGPHRAHPGHVRHLPDPVGHRGVGGVARPALGDEGMDRGRGGHRGGRGAAVRRCVAPSPARVVRQLLQRPVRGLLQPGLRDPDGRAVPGAGWPGRDPGGDRQVDRVRRQGRLRHPERAVGGLPAQGGAGAVRALHAALAVHRRLHRPVRASSCRVVDQPHHVGDRRCHRHRRARALGDGTTEGKTVPDDRPDPGAPRGTGRGPRDPGREVGGDHHVLSGRT